MLNVLFGLFAENFQTFLQPPCTLRSNPVFSYTHFTELRDSLVSYWCKENTTVSVTLFKNLKLPVSPQMLHHCFTSLTVPHVFCELIYTLYWRPPEYCIKWHKVMTMHKECGPVVITLQEFSLHLLVLLSTVVWLKWRVKSSSFRRIKSLAFKELSP